MDKSHLKEWHKLPDNTKHNIFKETGTFINLNDVATEKDWWLVNTLSLIFSMECAPSLSFKGGTSLSKGWNLIQRFSEDIDLGLDKEYLGFNISDPNKKQVNQLRRLSYEFIVTRFIPELKSKFADAGFNDVQIKPEDVVNHDQDPLNVEIYYPKLTEKDPYLKPGLLVEVGSRSLKEPHTQRTFSTFVSERFSDQTFSDKAITIPVVNPERTFLEKIFLLHEEFQRSDEKKRVERLSRHLYDIEKISQTEYKDKALQNEELYKTIIKHRSKFVKLADVDYTKHLPQYIKFLPPEILQPLWKDDYKRMLENMIYGEKIPYDVLIERLSELQNQINGIRW